MFGRRKFERLEREIELLRGDLKFVDQRYWELYHKHYALLGHLGLEVVSEPSRTVVRKVALASV